MDVYNERNGVEFKAHFADAYDTPTIPSTVHWRLDCETTNTVLQGDTEIAAETLSDESGVVDVFASIEVPGALNAIQNNRNAKELKTLLVIADKGMSSEYSQTYQYYVKNLRGRS